MKKTLLIALTLIPLMSLAQNRVQNYIDQRMKTDSLLINAVVGILAVDSQGREIAAWNPDMPLLTASTMKTITTGLGYEVLGPGYRFSTRVAYDGRIENGVLHGNLYIVGGADPTLGSRDTIAGTAALTPAAVATTASMKRKTFPPAGRTATSATTTAAAPPACRSVRTCPTSTSKRAKPWAIPSASRPSARIPRI